MFLFTSDKYTHSLMIFKQFNTNTMIYQKNCDPKSTIHRKI